MELSADELTRYQRQISIPGWGAEAQRRLKQSAVFLAGVGGLGSAAAIYLAAAGVGQLALCDFDRVEHSNLNRQILHDHSRVGMSKVASAQVSLARLNAAVEVLPLAAAITEENVDGLVGDACLIVDCLDNFETRYVLNSSAIRKGIPLVHASVSGLEGRLSFIHVPRTPCLRCTFPEGPPPVPVPVLGATPGVIGSLQAMEAVKYLANLGGNLLGRLLVWDGGTMEFLTLRTRRDPSCPLCPPVPSGHQP
jgi:adenylyltransferase/sulfurtransferase